MAYEIKGQTISLKASVEIKKEDKFKPVSISGDNTFKLAGAEDKVVGVIQNECKAGEAGQVMIDGVTFFKCTDTVAAGAAVGTWGIALQAGVVGDVISVLIK
jgi:hypothetical protein